MTIASVALGLAGAGAGIRTVRRTPASPFVEHFSLPLRIPPVLRPASSDATTDYYELVEQEADVDILPGRKTRIWGYNGLFPGPTLIGRKGRVTKVSIRNHLRVHTVTHLHGGVNAPDSDGFPTDMVMPGDSRIYTYSNLGRGATLWYHDHTMDHTAHNIYMGLAGLYIFNDEEERPLRLPAGEFDIPLVLQQRQFAPDGSLTTWGITSEWAEIPRSSMASLGHRFVSPRVNTVFAS